MKEIKLIYNLIAIKVYTNKNLQVAFICLWISKSLEHT